MNKRLLFLLLISYTLLLAAALSRTGSLVLMAVPFLAYLLVGMAKAPASVRLIAQRELSKTSAETSSPVEVRLRIENVGRSLQNLWVGDRLGPGAVLINGKPAQRLALPAGTTVELSYTFTGTRGTYAWESVEAVASDPFGLVELPAPASAPGEVLMQPVKERLKHITLRPGETLHSAGPIPARRAGSGTDFWGVRQYRPGDPLRSLVWRRTARHPNQFFTKEFEQEEIADIGLILDARTLTCHSNGNGTLFEYAASACASLAELFMREGNRVGLMIYGDRLPYLPPGYGKLQYNRILAELARATPGSNFTLDSLKNLPVRLFPSRALLVFISPLADQDSQALARLRANGYQIILVSPDPVRFATSHAGSGTVDKLAFRAARLERVMQLKRLIRMGIRVVDWPVDQPLTVLLSAAFRQTSNRQRQV